ncbi:Polysaccharide lyase family 4, domain II [Algoriphagus ornithinivorans]|uniref:Polysaccharide lyase family 4, domain II n=1 Tax=Algoriphagus ornithinivorans TaxID=226506 RepID=A0A1I5G1B4_9BACT|nr:Ig-like domain-containing domain [Algoriphagus ornithinivorans]SFO29663.1 Polysaccharide lyase family 4, domain II [Algoriphagus ornithinivorans]
MKIKYTFLLVFSVALFTQCAKQSTPQGGPRDEDPPKLLEANPKDQSINIKPEEIVLVFDEYIKLDNPNKNIIITPRVKKDEVVTTALKNTVTIELNQELEDNTTYVFNFQKSVQDLSEGNPAENLKIVFSTGSSIDSLELSGQVNFYFPDKQSDFKNVLVGLYPENDTTDLFTAAPYYISQVDSTGQFKISNIKNGNYRAYAWNDANNSLKAEFKSEAHDFLKDTITIEENIEGAIFNLSQADLTPIRLLRSSFTNGSYDLILNKNAVDIKLENESLGKSIFYTKEDKRIRLFSDKSIPDSLAFKVKLIDSVGYQIDTLIYVKFPVNERKPEELTVTANSGKNFTGTMEAILSFNKPITKIHTDSLYIPLDSVRSIKIGPEMYYFEDSSMRNVLRLKVSIPDSTQSDVVTLTVADSTFQDIQLQYNLKELKANYRKIRPETLADLLAGRINNAEPPFVVQLLDNKDELKAEKKLIDTNNFRFERIEAGTYKIRVIEDRNGNGRWDPGNFFENKQAERIFYFKNPENSSTDIIIRGGWTNDGIIIEPSKPTGISQKKPVDNPSEDGG